MPRITIPALCLAALLPAASATANTFVPLTDEAAFVQLVDGREMTLGLFGIRLAVTPDGRIAGRAAGWDITGTWAWQDGLFCREMDWGGSEIPYNCQLVEVQGEDRIRFTVDAGAGRAATLTLR